MRNMTWLAAATLAALAGCSSDGGGTGGTGTIVPFGDATTAADVQTTAASDTTASSDTSSPGGGSDTPSLGSGDAAGLPDATGAEDATADTAVDDTGAGDATEPDTNATPVSCDPETVVCPMAPDSQTNVTILQFTGLPAPLTGGTPPDGAYRLMALEVYPDSLSEGQTFAIPLVISSTATLGSARFNASEQAWILSALLEIQITADALGNPIESAIKNTIYGGGCYGIAETTLTGDLAQCAQGLIPEFELPDTFEYQSDGQTLRLLVALDRKAIIDNIPPDVAALAEAFITADLQMVLEFSRMGD